MTRIAFGRSLAVMGLWLAVVASSSAQILPSPLAHYHVVPRLSVLRQTGGFGGFDWRYRLQGEYDLQRGPDPVSQVSFQNAEIWGSMISKDPVPAVVIDVDQILNLEGLNGRVLPTMGPFPVYEFRGTTADDSKVQLLGAVIGPWMYLRGGTTPPDGSADFFSYHLRAVARSRPFADMNDDGAVDAADYVLLRKYGHAGFNGVTAADWAQQFGEQAPNLDGLDATLNAAMGSLGQSPTVPEPAAWILLVIGGLLSCARRTRQLSL